MNLKYYLRGLGIGIIVAAILMGVATNGNDRMTDAEIKERAAQLGMVESKVLADITNNAGGKTPEENQLTVQPTVPPEIVEETKKPEKVNTPDATEEPKEVQETTEGSIPEATEEPEASQAPIVNDEPEATKAPEINDEPEATEVPDDGDAFMITIRAGASSWTVSKELAEYGLVADAKEFDRFLSRGGYDKSICIGEFEIIMGATYEEIAKIITKRD